MLKEKWINDFVGHGPMTVSNGVEVRPETKINIAIGKIKAIEEKGKNNLRIVLEVSGAKFDFSGFLNDNTPVAELVKQAKERELPICVRFERKRKTDVDPTKSINELTKDANVARDNIVKIVAGVFNFSNSEWILADGSVSNPDEDPDYVLDELKKAQYNTEGFFKENTPKIKTSDKDWKVNHLVSMFTYVSEHDVENKLELEVKTRKTLAVYMLKACDQLQMKVKGLDTPNYSDYSHTKVRGMLFSWMRVNPLTKDIITGKGNFNKWITKFMEENLEIWNWATTEVEN